VAATYYSDSVYQRSLVVKAANIYVNDTVVPCVLNFNWQGTYPVTRADGLDIVITDVSGNLIDRYVEANADDTFTVRFNDPSQNASTGGTTVYVQWGGATVNVANSTNIFLNCHGGTDDYFLVIPGEDTGADLTDISGNYNSTDQNLTYSQTGKVNKCPSWDNVGGNTNWGDVTEVDSATTLSGSMWVWQDDLDVNAGFLRKVDDSTHQIYFDTNTAGNMNFYMRNGGTNYARFDYSGLVSADTWFHLRWSYDGGGATNADKFKVWINDTAVSLTFNGTHPSSLADMSTNNFYFGNRDGDYYPFNGLLDEVRFFTGTMSLNQFKFTGDNTGGFATNAVFTLGTVEAASISSESSASSESSFSSSLSISSSSDSSSSESSSSDSVSSTSSDSSDSSESSSSDSVSSTSSDSSDSSESSSSDSVSSTSSDSSDSSESSSSDSVSSTSSDSSDSSESSSSDSVSSTSSDSSESSDTCGTNVIDSKVSVVASDTTTAGSTEDIDGSECSITLHDDAHIFASMSLSSSVSGSGISGFFGIEIDGTTSPMLERKHSGATNKGSVGVVYRTPNTLSAGTYTVKGRWYTSSGTLTGTNVTLVAIPMETCQAESVTSFYDTVATDSVASTTLTDITGLSQIVNLPTQGKIFVAIAGATETSGNNKDMTIATNIDGELQEISRLHTTADDKGNAIVFDLTDNILGSGNHTVKGQMRANQPGVTATVEPSIMAGFATTTDSGEIIPAEQTDGISDTTTATSIEDIDGLTTEVTLPLLANIYAAMVMETQCDQSAVNGYFVLNIDGVDYETITRYHSTANDQGAVTVFARTDQPLPIGTYTVKGRWYTDAGNELSCSNANIIAIAMAVGEFSSSSHSSFSSTSSDSSSSDSVSSTSSLSSDSSVSSTSSESSDSSSSDSSSSDSSSSISSLSSDSSVSSVSSESSESSSSDSSSSNSSLSSSSDSAYDGQTCWGLPGGIAWDDVPDGMTLGALASITSSFGMLYFTGTGADAYAYTNVLKTLRAENSIEITDTELKSSYIIEMRGSATSFGKTDVSPSWELYSGPVNRLWRYIQMRVRRP
jgi:hypothetical protein